MHEHMTATFVVGTREIAQGYSAVEVRTSARSALPAFGDGALVDTMRRGANGVVRTYPLCRSSTRSDVYVIGMRTGSGRDSLELTLKDGDEILVGKPRTTPVTLYPGARYILLGGGIGIAAIAGVARKLAASGMAFELHNFARTPQRAVFRAELDSVREHGRVYHHVGLSAEQIAQAVAHALGPTHANSQVYCSGPPAFMDFVRQRATQWVYPENVHRILLGDRTRA
ncbi:oxidoreductase [Paraburkholderia sp. MMS20-SJTR3]|uniref:Oxidoreductase n=1 Tax=Paraburkholderia sejongensis TaxID=2886946 RepID=A0ABS8JRK9_9BURK|nr:oxidoreductase [Paraburkholderia sp. MMS20-SJTR3]MCC8392543.1 oxidoreductase [Paraburkholderia sp. MMS20-SJTR3]